MAKISPNSLAMKHLKSNGWEADKVEQRLPIPGKYITRDLFSVIDIVAMKEGEPLLAIQATTRSHVNNRMTKSQEKARVWVSTGNRFEIWGYALNGKRVVAMTTEGWVSTIE